MTKLYTLLVAIILLLSAAVSVRAEGAAEVQVGDYLVFGHYDQDNNKRNPAEPEHIMTKWGVGYYFKG